MNPVRRLGLSIDTVMLFVILFDMQINVSGLLREFPKAKRAAFAGECVRIKTREGNLILMAEKPASESLFGALAEQIQTRKLEPETSGADETDWEPSL